MDELTPLKQLGEAIIYELVASMHRKGRVASGKTINDIILHVDGMNRIYIDAPYYIIALERGRKATNSHGPFQASPISFKQSLALWMAARGIDQGPIKGNAKYGPVLWAIYTNINKKGFPGTPGLLSGPLANEALNKAMDKNLGNLADIYVKTVFDEIFK